MSRIIEAMGKAGEAMAQGVSHNTDRIEKCEGRLEKLEADDRVHYISIQPNMTKFQFTQADLDAAAEKVTVAQEESIVNGPLSGWKCKGCGKAEVTRYRTTPYCLLCAQRPSRFNFKQFIQADVDAAVKVDRERIWNEVSGLTPERLARHLEKIINNEKVCEGCDGSGRVHSHNDKCQDCNGTGKTK